MPTFENGRALVQALQELLDEWVSEARVEAYAELFEGPDAVLTDEELATLDRIDSLLSREEGTGVWGTDTHAIIPAGTFEEESTPHVVCTYYPQIPDYENQSTAPVDNETQEKLNEALWDYSERVVELVQQRLEKFVWSSEVETWQE